MTQDDVRTRELLERRARRLARRGVPRTQSTVRTLLRFEVDDESFAVPADRVLEVMQVERLTPLPGATHGWIALALWRGQVVAVKDVHAGRERDFQNSRAKLVLVDAPLPFGLYADVVSDLIEVEESALHRPPADRDEYGAWTEAVTADAVVVISIERILDHDLGRRPT